jgi:hypothetical protein
MTTLYPGFVNSPTTKLTSGITDIATTIPVAELSIFPPAPNIATIGTGTDCETILYGAKSAASGSGNLTSVTREFDVSGTYGAKKAWVTGDVIGRNFTNYDYASLRADSIAHGSPNASIMLMPGGAFVPTTDPAGWEQGETAGGNCYQYGDFSYTAAARMQWTIPVPLGFTSGTNLTAIFYWTASTAAAGDVKWDLAAYRPDNGVSLDTTLVNVTTVTDTFLGTDLMHVTAETSAFAITGDGRFIVFELTRDYVDGADTLDDSARILAVEVKYVRSQTY